MAKPSPNRDSLNFGMSHVYLPCAGSQRNGLLCMMRVEEKNSRAEFENFCGLLESLDTTFVSHVSQSLLLQTSFGRPQMCIQVVVQSALGSQQLPSRGTASATPKTYTTSQSINFRLTRDCKNQAELEKLLPLPTVRRRLLTSRCLQAAMAALEQTRGRHASTEQPGKAQHSPAHSR